MNNFFKKGFTLIEVLVIVFIMTIISLIVVKGLSGFKNDQALRNTTYDIVSILNKARQNTLSSINSTNYSVHFDTDKAVLFSGSVYSSSDASNEIVKFNTGSRIIIPSGLSIGGGRDVTFERLTGDTIGGSITVELTSNSSRNKIITISPTGNVSSN